MAIPTPKILVMDRSLLDQTLGSPTLDNWISRKDADKRYQGKNKGLRKESQKRLMLWKIGIECISKKEEVVRNMKCSMRSQ